MDPTWNHHTVVVKDGKVYHAFTGREGPPVVALAGGYGLVVGTRAWLAAREAAAAEATAFEASMSSEQ